MKTAILFLVSMVAVFSGCLGDRPTGADAGTGGATMPLGGAGGGTSGPGGGGAKGSGGTGPGGAGTGGTSGAGGVTGAGGTTLGAPALSGTTSNDFGSLMIGNRSAQFTWTIQNAAGAAPTGALQVSNNDSAEVKTFSGCTGMLAGGASCEIAMTFTPTAAGPRTAMLTVSAAPGGTVTLSLTATGTAQVTVTTVGIGTVNSAPPGISCPGTCTATFSSPVTLHALNTNGSNFFFSGWSDPACPGPFRDCTEPLNLSNVEITATFSAMSANLIFGTVETFPTSMIGTAGYDLACNRVATIAGLNNGTANGYIAAISDSNSNAISRTGNARGWVRLDGKPFANTPMASDQQIFYPFLFGEDGSLLPAEAPAFVTATSTDGTAFANNCGNWTSTDTSTFTTGGSSVVGPLWSAAVSVECGVMANLICLGITKNVSVTPPPAPSTGKKIWITDATLTVGSETPDAHCQRSLPAGVTTAAALLSTTQKAASSVLVPTASYYRVDGAFVGTGADIAMMGATSSMLTSGVWQTVTGSYPGTGDAWTGSLVANQVGTVATTCNNWSDSSQTGEVGHHYWANHLMWAAGTSSCTAPFNLYCVQTSP